MADLLNKSLTITDVASCHLSCALTRQAPHAELSQMLHAEVQWL